MTQAQTQNKGLQEASGRLLDLVREATAMPESDP